MTTQHTDSVEATLEILRHKYALYGDEGYSNDLLQDIKNALTTLQATQSQQVEEAVKTARSLELETLAVHLDRQLAGYTAVDLGSLYRYIQQRQEALTPNHQD